MGCPSPDQVAAWRTFLEAHARVTAELAAELEAEAGLPLTWYDVLVQLSEAPDHRLRITDLANRVLLSKAGLSRLVDRMAETGMVARQPCPEDRRGTFVQMTEAGQRALERAAPIHLRGVAEHFTGRMGAEELKLVAEALAKVGRSA
ncbi:MAG: MarR family winged helix-turn-helix transcriptional regulator [Dehalococcoidia bacterium]